MDMLNIYKVYLGRVLGAIARQGPGVTQLNLAWVMRWVRCKILWLLTVFIKKSRLTEVNLPTVAQEFLPQCWTPYLGMLHCWLHATLRFSPCLPLW